jgi:proline dehydrogenase
MSGPVLRAPVLRIARARWFHALATGRLGWRVASRFVAGEHLDDAIRVAGELDRRKVATILDHLGENVTAPEHAAAAVRAYIRALERIGAERSLDLCISVKLTQLGLDFSNELCVANLEQVLAAARDAGAIVMIDMESSV